MQSQKEGIVLSEKTSFRHRTLLFTIKVFLIIVWFGLALFWPFNYIYFHLLSWSVAILLAIYLGLSGHRNDPHA
jgi:hypothetical protein